MTIPEAVRYCKNAADALIGEWGLAALIFFACLGSFGLGRLSALIDSRPLVSIGSAPSRDAPAALVAGGLVIASKTGKVYYYPWCGGANRIAVQNRRYFVNAEDAERAGYRPATNCKGLAD